MEFEISTIREQAAQPTKAALFSSGLTRFRTKAFVAIVPMTVTFTLGLWGIRRQNSMWGDESVTYQLAHRDLTQLWRTAQHVDLVHAFYYAIMHEIYSLVGGGLLTLRLPSVLAMSAAAAGVGLLGLRLAGPRAGLPAGLVFPFVPQIQQYTQEGRSYSMVCALVTWATYALLPLAIRSAGESGQVAWIAWPDPVQFLGFLAMVTVGMRCARRPMNVRGPIQYVLYSSIGFVLLLGAGIDRFHRRQLSSRTSWVAALAVLTALLPPSLYLWMPQSRHDDVIAIGNAVRHAGRPGDGLLYLPGRHRVWTGADPEDTRFLTDLALVQDPTSSNTLAGIELPVALCREDDQRLAAVERSKNELRTGASSPPIWHARRAE
ncbi:hypothetical protein [Streptomyces mirabilis]|uniref:hypothetical protein n=1 Tax=Streptomyces mirabilis TaxID=68239 RepID=UPI0036E2D470